MVTLEQKDGDSGHKAAFGSVGILMGHPPWLRGVLDREANGRRRWSQAQVLGRGGSWVPWATQYHGLSIMGGIPKKGGSEGQGSVCIYVLPGKCQATTQSHRELVTGCSQCFASLNTAHQCTPQIALEAPVQTVH